MMSKQIRMRIARTEEGKNLSVDINRKKPKVTVLMSVYNGEKYLPGTIESILNQTFTDFEFIIINDGSTDGTTRILESCSDPRIIIINNQKNVGLTKSLNKGLKIARGEYIARQDASDVSMPRRLEKEVDFLEKHKSTGLIGSSFQLISESGEPLAIQEVLTGNDEIKRALLEGNQFSHGSVMFRKEYVENVGGYREEIRFAQDYDLWLRISEKYDVANIAEPLYKWRVSLDGISIARKDEQDRYADFIRELAGERRNRGKDKLQTSDKEEIKRILDNLFPGNRKRSKTEEEKSKRKEISRFYQGCGSTCLSQAKRGQARKQYLTSLKYNPWNLRSFIYLCCTFLPSGIVKILRLGKKKLKSFLLGE